MKALVLVPALLFGVAAALGAQELTYDEASGNYRLRYFSPIRNEDVMIEVVPPNKVAPQLDLIDITAVGSDQYRYSYRLSNRLTPNSAQPLHEFELDCPNPEETETSGPPGWIAYQHAATEWMSGPGPCTFVAVRTTGIQPGGSAVGFRVTTSWVPRIAQGAFWGLAPRSPSRAATRRRSILRCTS